MRRALCVHLFVLGCGHPTPPPQPPPVATARTVDAAVPTADGAAALDDDLPRLAARAVLLYQAWQHALEDAGEDCAKAAAGMNAVADQYADVIAANARVLKAGRDKVKALRNALAPHQADMDAAAAAIMRSKALAACTQDHQFVTALDRIGGSPP
jgi:hypothetical protein